MNNEIQKAAFPGKYIQGENSIYQLPELIRLLGNKALLLASNTVINKIIPKYEIFDNEMILWKQSTKKLGSLLLKRSKTL